MARKGISLPVFRYEFKRIRPFGATLIRSKTIALVSLDGGTEDEEDLFFRIGAVLMILRWFKKGA